MMAQTVQAAMKYRRRDMLRCTLKTCHPDPVGSRSGVYKFRGCGDVDNLAQLKNVKRKTCPEPTTRASPSLAECDARTRNHRNGGHQCAAEATTRTAAWLSALSIG